MKRLVSFGTIFAVASALIGGTAFAATGSANFYELDLSGCHVATTERSHGTARWDTSTATVAIRVRKLSPNTEYQVQEVAGCGGNVEILGTLTTNNGGSGSGSFTFTPQGVRSFWLVPTTGGTAYATESVNLNP